MIYNINSPPIVIFNAANLEKSQQQKISYGIELLKSNGEIHTSLPTWFNHPPVNVTWAIFKKKNSNSHKNLLKIRGNTMQNTPYHHANQAIQKLTK